MSPTTTDTLRYPLVRIQRRTNGRLWKVLIENEDGSFVDLPVYSINYEHSAQDTGQVALAVGSHRVEFETISEADCGY